MRCVATIACRASDSSFGAVRCGRPGHVQASVRRGSFHGSLARRRCGWSCACASCCARGKLNLDANWVCVPAHPASRATHRGKQERNYTRGQVIIVLRQSQTRTIVDYETYSNIRLAVPDGKFVITTDSPKQLTVRSIFTVV